MPADNGNASPLATWLIMRLEKDAGGDNVASDLHLLSDLDRAADCAKLLGQVGRSLGDHTPVAAAAPTTIARFRVERLIGRGGMGHVFLAHDPVLHRSVALKIPRVDLTSDPEQRGRFFREAQLAARLEHPHLVPVYEAGTDGRSCYIASAWCDGPDIAAWLRERPRPVAPTQAARLVADLANTMQYCHEQGVLHRDLKPGNVLMDRHGNEGVNGDGLELDDFTPRITDFGLARVVQDSFEQTDTSLLLGTPQYMAPEQAECRDDLVGPETDVYALGVILYEMLTRRTPFAGATVVEILDQIRHREVPSVRKWRPDVPRDLDTICRKCLQKRPADRYRTAQELGDDLRRFCCDEPIFARRVSIATRINGWSRKPARVRDAATLSIGLNIIIIFWSSFIAVAGMLGMSAATGNVGVKVFLLQSVSVIVFPHGLMILASVQMLRGSRRAVWVATIVAGIFWVWITAILAGAPAPFNAYQQDPLARFVVFWLLEFLSALQFGAVLLALRCSIRRSG